MIVDGSSSLVEAVLVGRKAELRTQIKSELAKLSADFVAEASASVCKELYRFICASEMNDYPAVLGWASCFYAEIDLTELLNRLIGIKDLYLPSYLSTEQMCFARIDVNWKDQLDDKSKGFVKPLATDSPCWRNDCKAIVLLPGLGFDRKGGRLGRGSGYYDRFLAGCLSSQVLKMGICLDLQLIDQIPVGSNDILVDYVCTEKGCISVYG